MGDRTSIEWTDATWNPIRARWIAPTNDGSGVERVGWHCEHVSEGCRNCYAESINRRLGTQLDFKPGNLFRPERVGYSNGDAKVFLDEKMLLAPLRWRRPRRIFVCSMTDLFADFVPDAMIDQVFALMALAARHTFQVLTKRPARMRSYLSDPATPGRIARRCVDLWLAKIVDPDDDWPVDSVGPIDMPADLVMRSWPLPNVWLGVSAEDQATADARIPELLATPAAIRFVSAEPLLGPVHLGYLGWPGGSTLKRTGYNALLGCRYDEGEVVERIPRLDWVIAGGESGPGARPMHPDSARSLRDQCGVCGVAFLFKQWGEWLPGAQYNEACHSADRSDTESRFSCMDWTGDKYEAASSFWADEPGEHAVYRVGKRRAGRLLDGVTHDGFPEVRHG